MEEYDDAKLNYESGFSPEVKEFLRRDRRTFKDGKINVETAAPRSSNRQAQSPQGVELHTAGAR